MNTLTATREPASCSVSAQMEAFYVHTFPVVARFVSKMNGTMDDAKDVFQDAVIIYLEKDKDAMDRPVHDQQRYLLGIAKHLWLKKFSKSRSTVKLDAFESLLNVPDYRDPGSMRTDLLLRLLENTGRRCLDLLRDFYFQKLTMKGIAANHGFGSERSATVQKYKCIEKLRENIKDKSLVYEDFFE